jgi:hypothetical protein
LVPLTQDGNRLDFLDPVSQLEIDQPVSQTTKRRCMAAVPFPSQILSDEIEPGGEGAKVVVCLDMEL